MKILLHIGQSKTGTSAIQAYLTLNRAKLAEQGVLYPAVSFGGLTVDIANHNPVADALCQVMRYPNLSTDTYFNQFFAAAERTGARRMILSAEHLFGGEPRIWNVSDPDAFAAAYRRKIECLKAYLSGHEVEVLVYLRPQAHWLASAIAQTVRTERLIRDSPIYESDRQFFEMAKPILSYASILAAWRDVLQPEHLMIVPYDRRYLAGESSIADFLQRVGLDATGFRYGDTNLQVNSSLTREFVEVKKRFNRQPHSKIAERVAIGCLEQLSRERGGDTAYRLAPELLKDIQAFAMEENAALEAAWGLDPRPLNAVPAAAEPVAEADVNAAWEVFQCRFHGPRARLAMVDQGLRALLREHAPPLHSLLHQAKRQYRRWRYRAADTVGRRRRAS